LSGPSRKSFLKQAIGDRLPAEREWGTAAAVTAADPTEAAGLSKIRLLALDRRRLRI